MEAAKLIKTGITTTADLQKVSKVAGLTAKEAQALSDMWKLEGFTGKTENLVNFGDDFGKTGVYVKNPEIKVDWSIQSSHGSQRLAERGLSQENVDKIVKSGEAFSQAGGNKFLIVTKEGAVVVSKEGKLVTAWGKADFDDPMKELLKKIYGD
jgi:hypothetical protein